MTKPSFQPTPWQTLPQVCLPATPEDRSPRIDLWLFFHEATDHSAPFAAYFPLLTDEERARHDRFVFDRDRRIFLATRALVRCVLAEYTGMDPRDFRFASHRFGKPFVDAPRLSPALSFNLSNTHNLVVCAVTLGDEMIGVDVESLDRASDPLSLADHVFAPAEIAALRSLPVEDQQERFCSYWTLKESYIKARGLGLQLPLSQFAFTLGAAPAPTIAFDPRLADDAAAWSFALLSAFPTHLLAVAKKQRPPLALHACRYVPLKGMIPPVK